MSRVGRVIRRTFPLLLVCALGASCSLIGGGDGEGEAASDSTAVDSTQVDSAAVDSAVVDSAAADSAKAKKKVPEGVPVKVSPLETGEISEFKLFSTTVEAEGTVDVYAEASGLVREVMVEEGDLVRAGEVLIRLADDDLKLQKDAAEVSYRKINSQFERKKEIFSRKLISNEKYERFRFDLDEARIRWERAKLALDHTSVQSPVEGVVAERLVKLGDRIGQSNKLFVLVDMASLITRVHVPGQEIRNLTVGRPAMITTDFLPGESFKGRILRISPVVDPASGTFKVTVGLDDGRERLRPGMYINTHIVTDTHSGAILVPKRAVVYDDGIPHVFVVRDTMAKKLPLTVGYQDGENLEVLSGLGRDERIVTVGQSGLKDEARIRIIEGEGFRIPAERDTTKEEGEAS